MKLRSGRATDKGASSIIDNYNKFSISVKEKLYIYEKNPCSKSIKNLKYIMYVYNQIDEEFFEILNNEELSNIRFSIVNFILILYKKTLELMSGLIGKTYDKKSTKYDSSTKEMIVKTLYKMRNVFIKLRKLLYDMEEESECIKSLLDVSVKKAGKTIKDKSSTEALAYYCYSHLYGNEEYNRYNISSYEDGEYSYEEIYDYYFGANIEKYIEDDMFIREDYKYWFTYNEITDNYHLYGYRRHKLKEKEPLYKFNELKRRVEYYKDETIKYFEMMAEMYPEEMDRTYPEVMDEILHRQRREEDDEE